MRRTFRTFVAVEISSMIRTRAGELIATFSGTAADVKWVEPHNLHLTLKFIGEVHEREMGELLRAVVDGARRVQAFDLEVCGAGAFPNVARPRTVWLGAGEGRESMIELHDSIEAELANLGYREEHRRFQTHLTIGRVRGTGIGITALGELLQQHADDVVGRMTVQKATVFSSTLTPDGPLYEVVGTAALGKK